MHIEVENIKRQRTVADLEQQGRPNILHQSQITRCEKKGQCLHELGEKREERNIKP